MPFFSADHHHESDHHHHHDSHHDSDHKHYHHDHHSHHGHHHGHHHHHKRAAPNQIVPVVEPTELPPFDVKGECGIAQFWPLISQGYIYLALSRVLI